MKSIYFCLLITFFTFQSDLTKANVLPAGLEKCQYSNSVCLKERIQQVISEYAKKGIKSINLIKFDPLHLNRLKLSKNQNSPVSIDLEFKDIDLIGLQSTKIVSVEGFDAEAKQPIEVKALIPKLALVGQYKVDGRVLILPIVGKGASEILFDNLKIGMKLKSKLIKKADKEYLDITAVALSINPQHVKFDLQGLFHQDKVLGDNMLNFINENWQEIFSELKPDIEEALSLVFKQILNNIFSKHPYNQYLV